jgi:hypothetical protein
MSLMEQQFSVANLGPRPGLPQCVPGQGVTRIAPACARGCNRPEVPTGRLGTAVPPGLSAPTAEGLPVRAGKPRHDGDLGDATGTGSRGDEVARRKQTDVAGSRSPLDPGPPSGWPDLIAFVAVLTTGTLLVLLGHVATGGLTTACLALGGLFAAWWRFRKPRRR